MVCPQTESSDIQVTMKMFHCLNNCEQFFPGYTIISFCFSQRMTKVTYDFLLTILNLRQNGTNRSILLLASVSRTNSPPLGSGQESTGLFINFDLSPWKASLHSIVNTNGLFSVSAFNGRASFSKLQINLRQYEHSPRKLNCVTITGTGNFYFSRINMSET